MWYNVNMKEEVPMNRLSKNTDTALDSANNFANSSMKHKEEFEQSIVNQQEWAKENYWTYGLALSEINDEAILSRLNSLEGQSVKEYVINLIRNEMANTHIEDKPRINNSSNDDTKKTCVNLKFNREKDKDIIEYLQSKEFKRNYLISLIEEDMNTNK